MGCLWNSLCMRSSALSISTLISGLSTITRKGKYLLHSSLLQEFKLHSIKMGRQCGGWVSLLKALHQLSMNTYSTIFLVNFNFLLFFENSLPKARYCLQIARTCPEGKKSGPLPLTLRVDVRRKIRKITYWPWKLEVGWATQLHFSRACTSLPAWQICRHGGVPKFALSCPRESQ